MKNAIRLGKKGYLGDVLRKVLTCQKCVVNGFGQEDDGDNEYQLLFFPCEEHKTQIDDLIRTGHVYK